MRPMLYEELRYRPVTPVIGPDPRSRDAANRTIAAIKIGLDAAVIVDATPATRVFFEIDRRDDFHYRDDFPVVTPPWRTTWIETHAPTRVRTERGDAPWLAQFQGSAWGAFVQSVDLTATQELAAAKAALAVEQPRLRGLIDVARWNVIATYFARFAGQRHLVGPIATMACWLDGTGAALAVDPSAGAESGYYVLVTLASDQEQLVHALMRSYHLAMLYTLSVANCRNVRLAETEPQLSRQQWRERTRHNETVRRYYTLEIVPNRRRTAASMANEQRVDRALHLCRGHFAHYTEDKPLFGKYAGTFWVPPHLRGSEESGVVGKEYRVEPAKGAAA